jgi:hypothetical protein
MEYKIKVVSNFKDLKKDVDDADKIIKSVTKKLDKKYKLLVDIDAKITKQLVTPLKDTQQLISDLSGAKVTIKTAVKTNGSLVTLQTQVDKLGKGVTINVLNSSSKALKTLVKDVTKVTTSADKAKKSLFALQKLANAKTAFSLSIIVPQLAKTKTLLGSLVETVKQTYNVHINVNSKAANDAILKLDSLYKRAAKELATITIRLNTTKVLSTIDLLLLLTKRVNEKRKSIVVAVNSTQISTSIKQLRTLTKELVPKHLLLSVSSPTLTSTIKSLKEVILLTKIPLHSDINVTTTNLKKTISRLVNLRDLVALTFAVKVSSKSTQVATTIVQLKKVIALVHDKHTLSVIVAKNTLARVKSNLKDIIQLLTPHYTLTLKAKSKQLTTVDTLITSIKEKTVLPTTFVIKTKFKDITNAQVSLNALIAATKVPLTNRINIISSSVVSANTRVLHLHNLINTLPSSVISVNIKQVIKASSAVGFLNKKITKNKYIGIKVPLKDVNLAISLVETLSLMKVKIPIKFTGKKLFNDFVTSVDAFINKKHAKIISLGLPLVSLHAGIKLVNTFMALPGSKLIHVRVNTTQVSIAHVPIQALYAAIKEQTVNINVKFNKYNTKVKKLLSLYSLIVDKYVTIDVTLNGTDKATKRLQTFYKQVTNKRFSISVVTTQLSIAKIPLMAFYANIKDQKFAVNIHFEKYNTKVQQLLKFYSLISDKEIAISVSIGGAKKVTSTLNILYSNIYDRTISIKVNTTQLSIAKVPLQTFYSLINDQSLAVSITFEKYNTKTQKLLRFYSLIVDKTVTLTVATIGFLKTSKLLRSFYTSVIDKTISIKVKKIPLQAVTLALNDFYSSITNKSFTVSVKFSKFDTVVKQLLRFYNLITNRDISVTISLTNLERTNKSLHDLYVLIKNKSISIKIKRIPIEAFTTTLVGIYSLVKDKQLSIRVALVNNTSTIIALKELYTSVVNKTVVIDSKLVNVLNVKKELTTFLASINDKTIAINVSVKGITKASENLNTFTSALTAHNVDVNVGVKNLTTSKARLSAFYATLVKRDIAVGVSVSGIEASLTVLKVLYAKIVDKTSLITVTLHNNEVVTSSLVALYKLIGDKRVSIVVISKGFLNVEKQLLKLFASIHNSYIVITATLNNTDTIQKNLSTLYASIKDKNLLITAKTSQFNIVKVKILALNANISAKTLLITAATSNFQTTHKLIDSLLLKTAPKSITIGVQLIQFNDALTSIKGLLNAANGKEFTISAKSARFNIVSTALAALYSNITNKQVVITASTSGFSISKKKIVDLLNEVNNKTLLVTASVAGVVAISASISELYKLVKDKVLTVHVTSPELRAVKDNINTFNALITSRNLLVTVATLNLGNVEKKINNFYNLITNKSIIVSTRITGFEKVNTTINTLYALIQHKSINISANTAFKRAINDISLLYTSLHAAEVVVSIKVVGLDSTLSKLNAVYARVIPKILDIPVVVSNAVASITTLKRIYAEVKDKSAIIVVSASGIETTSKSLTAFYASITDQKRSISYSLHNNIEFKKEITAFYASVKDKVLSISVALDKVKIAATKEELNILFKSLNDKSIRISVLLNALSIATFKGQFSALKTVVDEFDGKRILLSVKMTGTSGISNDFRTFSENTGRFKRELGDVETLLTRINDAVKIERIIKLKVSEIPINDAITLIGRLNNMAVLVPIKITGINKALDTILPFQASLKGLLTTVRETRTAVSSLNRVLGHKKTFTLLAPLTNLNKLTKGVEKLILLLAPVRELSVSFKGENILKASFETVKNTITTTSSEVDSLNKLIAKGKTYSVKASVIPLTTIRKRIEELNKLVVDIPVNIANSETFKADILAVKTRIKEANKEVTALNAALKGKKRFTVEAKTADLEKIMPLIAQINKQSITIPLNVTNKDAIDILFKSFTDGVKALNVPLKAVNKLLKTLETSINKEHELKLKVVTKPLEDVLLLVEKINKTTISIPIDNKNVTAVKENIKETKLSVSELNTALASVGKQLDKVDKSIAKPKVVTVAVKASIKEKLQIPLRQITEQVGKLSGTTLFMTFKLAGTSSIKVLTTALKALKGTIGIITGYFSQMNVQLRATERGVNFLIRSNNLLLDTITYTGIGAVKSYIDVQYTLNRVRAISNDTIESYTRLKEATYKVAQTTSLTNKQLAEGAEIFALAGLSIDEIIKLQPALATSVVNSGESLTENASNIISLARVWNTSMDSMDDVVSKLTTGMANAKTTIADLGQGMTYSGNAFVQVKRGTSELISVLQVLGNQAIRGSIAGRGLKTIMLRLANPTKEASLALNKLSISIVEANTNTDQFVTTNQQLEAKIALSRDVMSQLMTAFDSGETSIAPFSVALNELGIKTINTSGKFKSLEKMVVALREKGQLYTTLQDELTASFTRTNNVSGELTKSLRQVGVNVSDNTGRMRSIIDLTEEMASKMVHLSDAQKLAFADKLVGKNQADKFLAIITGATKATHTVQILDESVDLYISDLARLALKQDIGTESGQKLAIMYHNNGGELKDILPVLKRFNERLDLNSKSVVKSNGDVEGFISVIKRFHSTGLSWIDSIEAATLASNELSKGFISVNGNSNFATVNDALDALKGHVDNATDPARIVSFNGMVSKDMSASLLAAANASSEFSSETTTSFSSVVDAATLMRLEIEKSTKYTQDVLLSSWETTTIKIGEAFDPLTNKLYEIGTVAARVFGDLMPPLINELTKWMLKFEISEENIKQLMIDFMETVKSVSINVFEFGKSAVAFFESIGGKMNTFKGILVEVASIAVNTLSSIVSGLQLFGIVSKEEGNKLTATFATASVKLSQYEKEIAQTTKELAFQAKIYPENVRESVTLTTSELAKLNSTFATTFTDIATTTNTASQSFKDMSDNTVMHTVTMNGGVTSNFDAMLKHVQETTNAAATQTIVDVTKMNVGVSEQLDVMNHSYEVTFDDIAVVTTVKADEIKQGVVSKIKTMAVDSVVLVEGLKEQTVEHLSNMKKDSQGEISALSTFTVQAIADLKQDSLSEIYGMSEGFAQTFNDIEGQTTTKVQETKDNVITSVTAMKDDSIVQINALEHDAVSSIQALETQTTASFMAMKDNTTSNISALKDDSLVLIEGLKTEAITKSNQLKVGVVSEIADLREQSVRHLHGLSEQFAQEFNNTYTNVVTITDTMKKDVVTDVVDMTQQSSLSISSLERDVGIKFTKVKDDSVSKTAVMSQEISTKFDNMKTLTTESTNDMASSIVNTVVSLGNSIDVTASGMFDSVISSANNAATTVSNVLAQTKSSIETFMSSSSISDYMNQDTALTKAGKTSSINTNSTDFLTNINSGTYYVPDEVQDYIWTKNGNEGTSPNNNDAGIADVFGMSPGIDYDYTKYWESLKKNNLQTYGDYVTAGIHKDNAITKTNNADGSVTYSNKVAEEQLKETKRTNDILGTLSANNFSIAVN